MQKADRDLMVKRVNDAFKKWPQFEKMPVVDRHDVVRVAVTTPIEQGTYIAALYELCHAGAVPLGRHKDGVIVGEKPKAPA